MRKMVRATGSILISRNCLGGRPTYVVGIVHFHGRSLYNWLSFNNVFQVVAVYLFKL